jgi:hypothetical protein
MRWQEKLARGFDGGKLNLLASQNAPTTRPLCPKMQQKPPVPVSEALCFQSLNVTPEFTNFSFPAPGAVLTSRTNGRFLCATR